MKKRVTKCECLDFAEAVRKDRVYPLMYCHMELSGSLDIDRLKNAVCLSGKIVPEILCSYHFQKGCFTDAGHTAGDVIILRSDSTFMQPDISKGPQLQIVISQGQKRQRIVFIMSHVLADGNGFLQYLYLLAALYNQEKEVRGLKNERNIAPFLKNVSVSCTTQQMKGSRRIRCMPLRPPGKEREPYCLTVQISAKQMEKLRQKAKRCGVTLNDIFMTAYALVIARIQRTDVVTLPCPADLRRFYPGLQKLTVANMTGVYRRVAVELKEQRTFTEALWQIHIEMQLLSSRRLCFLGIKLLNGCFHKIPRPVLGLAVKAAYRLPPVSYSNIGMIDAKQLSFKNCITESCFVTGAYRLPPDFQLTVSTFRNVCTLNCTLLGSARDARGSRHILEQVRQEILKWLKEE